MKAHKTPASAALAQQVLAGALAQRDGLAGPFVLAISGLQGSGKSTLATAVTAAAQAHGLAAATVSLDDFYLTRAARQALAASVHPLLLTRGPPGTHDLALAHHVLDEVSRGRPVRLPRFDKLADDRLPEAGWPLAAAPLDLLVVEGWCLGVPAQADADLRAPLNALERDEDAQGYWRGYVNDALASYYPALWRRLQRLCVLQAPSFEIVSTWRGQQEQALVATRATSDSGIAHVGMPPAQLARFLQHYERLSRHALRTLPALADQVLPLDEARNVLA
ncbi:MAG TPA: kinase [Stenotrophomonas sp.]|nr:kinase [Stenotrophomonas sp.]